MPEQIKVVVVEDDPRMRERFAKTFAATDQLRVLGWGATVREGCELLDLHTPDVLLVDLGLPDGTGIDVIRYGHSRHPACDIMVVSVFGDQKNVLQSIAAGATGYLLKDDSDADFVGRISELRAGGSPITPIIARQLLQRLQPSTPDAPAEASGDVATLSARESEVLNLLARGFSYQDIARLLEVSPHTVGTYVKRLYEKLHVSSRGEAVFEAQCMGLLER